MIRTLLADDQGLVRSGLKALLDARDDIKVVAQAANGTQAVALTRRFRPDVVLMDIRMPELDGLEATRQITADRHSPRVRQPHQAAASQRRARPPDRAGT